MNGWSAVVENPELSVVLAAVGLLVGIVGTLVAVKSRRIRKPRFAVSGQNLIRDFAARLEGLDIRYRGQPISTLTVTKVAIWNKGSETIKSEDIASSDPLRISILGGEILDIEVIQTTKPSNLFKVAMGSEDEALVRFEYLDKNDGGVVQLLHTGSSPAKVRVLGAIIGAGTVKVPLLLQEAPEPPQVILRIVRAQNFTFKMSAVMMVAFAIAAFFSSDPKRGPEFFFLLLFAALFVLFDAMLRNPVPKRLTSFRNT